MGAISNGVGSKYANSFTLPATDSSRALKLLQAEFPAASGETDTIVWRAGASHTTQARQREVQMTTDDFDDVFQRLEKLGVV